MIFRRVPDRRVEALERRVKDLEVAIDKQIQVSIRLAENHQKLLKLLDPLRAGK